ncbi:hypothetical protein VNO78_07353 [Psophocarpus tetragonolobus]|uniref:Uncharacterized protein n=1 Tax=Psophocarpus tetragonolobus TaxID=3891 RepID=A0AAN9XSB6_PSOTE
MFCRQRQRECNLSYFENLLCSLPFHYALSLLWFLSNVVLFDATPLLQQLLTHAVAAAPLKVEVMPLPLHACLKSYEHWEYHGKSLSGASSSNDDAFGDDDNVSCLDLGRGDDA